VDPVGGGVSTPTAIPAPQPGQKLPADNETALPQRGHTIGLLKYFVK
jgi:hypothetical protein